MLDKESIVKEFRDKVESCQMISDRYGIVLIGFATLGELEDFWLQKIDEAEKRGWQKGKDIGYDKGLEMAEAMNQDLISELIKEVDARKDKTQNEAQVFAGEHGPVLSNRNDYQRGHNKAIENIIKLLNSKLNK